MRRALPMHRVIQAALLFLQLHHAVPAEWPWERNSPIGLEESPVWGVGGRQVPK